MPFKVRCRFVRFLGDPERYPCHFNYQEGDEFTYDGERYEGRICNGLLNNMGHVIWNTFFYGNQEDDRMIYLYSGASARDPDMVKYDGLGYRPLRSVPGAPDTRFYKVGPFQRHTSLIKRSRGFVCDDDKTGAYFVCEPMGLASGGDLITYYKRQMNILEKVKAEPGMTVKQILEKFTQWEREEIYPPIYELNVSLMLDEMAQVNLVEIRDGKIYPRGV